MSAASPAFLIISVTVLWINPRLDKQDLSEQAVYPPAPSSIANR